MKLFAIAGALLLAFFAALFGQPLLAAAFVSIALVVAMCTRQMALPVAFTLAIACAVALVVLTPPAFAQSASVDVGGIYGAWQPYILAVVMPAAAAIVGLLCEILRRKWNLDIEARHREALQTALTNGAGVALNKLGNSLQGKTIDVGNAAVAAGVNYAMKAAPAAMAKFGLTPEVVAEKITAKLPQVANTTTPVSG